MNIVTLLLFMYASHLLQLLNCKLTDNDERQDFRSLISLTQNVHPGYVFTLDMNNG